MPDDRIYLTAEGAAKLRKELEELKGPRRLEMADRLRKAVRQGDLSENADYISAKEQQAFLEGRILELESVLRNATIVERKASSERVEIGSTVVVLEQDESRSTFQIVGAKEANPRAGKISHESPIGKALLGKKVGQSAEATTPGGPIRFKVLEIR
ncbi:MAG TPA: transcription elongation factor GreA [Anaerolineales bacterium]